MRYGRLARQESSLYFRSENHNSVGKRTLHDDTGRVGKMWEYLRHESAVSTHGYGTLPLAHAPLVALVSRAHGCPFGVGRPAADLGARGLSSGVGGGWLARSGTRAARRRARRRASLGRTPGAACLGR